MTPGAAVAALDALVQRFDADRADDARGYAESQLGEAQSSLDDAAETLEDWTGRESLDAAVEALLDAFAPDWREVDGDSDAGHELWRLNELLDAVERQEGEVFGAVNSARDALRIVGDELSLF